MAELFSYRDQDIFVHHSVDQNPNPDDYNMHAHTSMEIFYFISGKGKYIVEGNTYDIHPHDILIFRSGEMHMILIDHQESYERLTIHFSPTVFAPVDPSGSLIMPFIARELGMHNLFPSTSENITARKTIYTDFDAYCGMKSDTRVHVLSRLLSVLVEISDEYNSSPKEHESKIALSSKIIAYINSHLYDDISLDSICNEFYVSKSQANRVFKNATEHSIWNYIVLKRLFTARERLLKNEPACKVCTECGFKDYSSFYRAYKSHFGAAPTSVNSEFNLEEKIV